MPRGEWHHVLSRALVWGYPLPLCGSFTLSTLSHSGAALSSSFNMSMRTRRKSKQAAAAAAAAAEPDIEPATSVASLEGPSRVEFTVPIPDDIDIEYLSRLLPDFSFETPSPDAILSLYRFVVSQAVDYDGALRDLEESRAEVEKKDIELDQALQDRESSVSSFETQVKSLQEELAKMKEERNTFGKFVVTLLGRYLLSTLSLLYSVVQKQSRVANIDSKQLALHLIHGDRLFQTQGRRH